MNLIEAAHNGARLKDICLGIELTKGEKLMLERVSETSANFRRNQLNGLGESREEE
ncbi:MAG: hypothetical protein LBO66_07540 [Deltaproteobacteria bacterium]|nr:hypothetical protein [Deltaproteobacteria bacterium]